jgi:DNA repair protein RecO (recombination protein O)
MVESFRLAMLAQAISIHVRLKKTLKKIPLMVSYLKTKGVVLRKYPFQDHHKIATIFTQRQGKVKTICRGITKVKSKFAPHLELGTVSDFMFYKGKSELLTLTYAKSIISHKNIRSDLKKTSSLYYLLELVDHLTEENHNDPAIYNLLLETLSFLDETKNNQKELLAVLAFNLKFLKQIGYLPLFYHCLSCKSEITEEDYFFSFKGGGLVCGNCLKSDVGVKLSSDQIKTMRFLERSSFDRIARLNISDRIIGEAEMSLSQYLRYLFSKQVKSAGFYRKVNV